MYEIFSNVLVILAILLIILALFKKEKNNNVVFDFVNKHYKLCLMFVFILFLFSRLYLFGMVPNTMHIDEASLAYNAYSIVTDGVDRYTNLFPIYFMNFEGGQSALYTYLAALFIKLFGYSVITVRLPALIFGFLTLVFGYLLAKEVAGRKMGILVAFLITICPYFIQASRWGLDCNLMLGMFTMSSYLLLKAINSENKFKFLLAGCMFGLTFYSYALSYLLVPLCLLLVLIYLIYTKKINFKNFLCFVCPLIILALPLILNVLINMGLIGEIHTRFFSIPKMRSDRVSEIGFSNLLENLFDLKNYLIGDGILFNAIPTYGPLYLFSVPFVLFGIFICFKKLIISLKEKYFCNYSYILILFFSFVLGLLLIFNAKYLNKGNALFIVLVIFLAIGLAFCFKRLKYSFLILILYLIYFGSFLNNYFYVSYTPSSFAKEINYMNALEDADLKNKEIYSINLDVLRWTNVWAGLGLKIAPWYYREDAKCFDKICFYVPFENEDDKIYIVLEERAYNLIDDGFTCKKYGNIYECFKE